MDKEIVERAVRGLAALNRRQSRDMASSHIPETYSRAPRPREDSESTRNGRGVCGSPQCEGCYEIMPGVRIHPPKCGEDYHAWFEHWEAKGKLQ